MPFMLIFFFFFLFISLPFIVDLVSAYYLCVSETNVIYSCMYIVAVVLRRMYAVICLH